MNFISAVFGLFMPLCSIVQISQPCKRDKKTKILKLSMEFVRGLYFVCLVFDTKPVYQFKLFVAFERYKLPLKFTRRESTKTYIIFFVFTNLPTSL